MRDNPSGAIHPTGFLFLWVAATFGMHRLWPLASIPTAARVPVGVALDLAGLVLLVWVHFEFRKHGTTSDHSRPTTALVTSGPFRISRHPVYLGLGAIMVGTGLVYDNLWAVLLAVPTLAAIQRFTVAREEAYLEREFGERYREYRQSVRPWI